MTTTKTDQQIWGSLSSDTLIASAVEYETKTLDDPALDVILKDCARRCRIEVARRLGA